MKEIVGPAKLWSRGEVLARPTPVPAASGIYGWYFESLPPGVDASGCVEHAGLRLLYVGISPQELAPPRLPSQETLRKRIRYHYSGNAEGSTLRRTLGVLLGLELRRVGSGTRFTFSSVRGRRGDEAQLDRWMSENAFVCWRACEQPWLVEQRLISSLDLPLNLRDNSAHPFHPVLSTARKAALARARELPVLT